MSCAVSFRAECGASTEVLDAWGELVNMVGGNLKAFLPPLSHLSQPRVRETPTYLYSEPDARVRNQMTFACLGHRLRLTILSRQA